MKKIDSQWQKAQETIFVEWINETLKPNIVVNNLEEDMKNGITLVLLVEKLTGHKCPERIDEKPRFRIQNISNCSVALRFIEREYKIKPLCSAENIVNGGDDIKYLLGLLFQIYMHHHKSKLISPKLTQQQQYEIILKWLREELFSYEIDLSSQEKMMENFFNGKILVALLDLFFDQYHQFYDWMLQRGEGERIGLSMRMAHDLLGVSELLKTEDVISHSVDFRVFFFYFDFLMNAFKNKASVMQIDLVQLVEEALQQLDKKQLNESKEDEEEYISTNQQERQMVKPQERAVSFYEKELPPVPKRAELSKKSAKSFDQAKEKQTSSAFRPIVLKDVLHHGRVSDHVNEPSTTISDRKGDEVPLRFTFEETTEKTRSTTHPTRPLPPMKNQKEQHTSTELSLRDSTTSEGKVGLRHRKHFHASERTSHYSSRTEEPHTMTRVYTTTTYSSNGRTTTASEITETTEIRNNETIVFGGFWLI